MEERWNDWKWQFRHRITTTEQLKSMFAGLGREKTKTRKMTVKEAFKQLTEEEAAVHPKSNVLLGCLGTEDEPRLEPHYIPQLQIGDSLLACTDGLWHYFTPEELGSVLHSLPPREASEFLVDKARSRAMGGGDNLSLAIVKVEPLVVDKPVVGSAFSPLR